MQQDIMKNNPATPDPEAEKRDQTEGLANQGVTQPKRVERQEDPHEATPQPDRPAGRPL